MFDQDNSIVQLNNVALTESLIKSPLFDELNETKVSDSVNILETIIEYIKEQSKLEISPAFYERIVLQFKDCLVLYYTGTKSLFILGKAAAELNKYFSSKPLDSQNDIHVFYSLMIPSFSLFIRELIKRKENASIVIESLWIVLDNSIELSSCLINYLIDYLIYEMPISYINDIFDRICDYVPQIKLDQSISSNFTKIIPSVGINSICYGNYIKLLCKHKKVNIAYMLFQRIYQSKMIKDEIIFNLIIDGFAKDMNTDMMLNVFDMMKRDGISPTIITYNTIIDGFIRSNKIETAWQIFEEVSKTKFAIDSYTYSILFRGIRLPEHAKYLVKSFNILDELSNSSQSSEVILINIIIDSCIAIKDQQALLKMWSKIKSGFFHNYNIDLITFNTLIKGFNQLELFDEGIQAFNLLKKLGHTPNDISFNSIIDLCVKSKNKEKIWEFIAEMENSGVKPDSFTYSIIIKGLDISAKGGICSDKEFQFAIELYNKVKINFEPDEIIYNCMMDVCIKKGDISKVFEIYHDMQISQVFPSVVTCGILIKAFGMSGNVEKAIEIFNKMEANGMRPSEITYGCIINTCIKLNRVEIAFQYFKDLAERNYPMNVILCTTLIKAYSKVNDLPKALEIYEKMKSDLKTQPNKITFNSIIDACIRLNNLKKAELIFSEMSEFKVSPDPITYSTMIKGFLKYKHPFKAISIIDSMIITKIYPDEMMLNSVLDCCERCNSLELAIKVFNYFSKLKMRPSSISYSIALKVYGKQNDFASSIALISKIESENQASLIIYTCFIKTCLNQSNIKFAVEYFEKIKKLGLEPDEVAYVTLLTGLRNKKSGVMLAKYLKESLSKNLYIQNYVYSTCLKTIDYLSCNITSLQKDLIEIRELMKKQGIDISESKHPHDAVKQPIKKFPNYQKSNYVQVSKNLRNNPKIEDTNYLDVKLSDQIREVFIDEDLREAVFSLNTPSKLKSKMNQKHQEPEILIEAEGVENKFCSLIKPKSAKKGLKNEGVKPILKSSNFSSILSQARKIV